MSEEKKRMYYVALTRAMKSEYILAYGTLKSPQIEADYNTILNELCGGGKTIKIK
jgi:DNA helicase-2/ATP-dependent DNA helicase PcrA